MQDGNLFALRQDGSRQNASGLVDNKSGFGWQAARNFGEGYFGNRMEEPARAVKLSVVLPGA
jgi:hypothetical protein